MTYQSCLIKGVLIIHNKCSQADIAHNSVYGCTSSSRIRGVNNRWLDEWFCFYQSVFIGNQLLISLVQGVCKMSTRVRWISTSRVCKSTVEGEASRTRLIYMRLGDGPGWVGLDDPDASWDICLVFMLLIH